MTVIISCIQMLSSVVDGCGLCVGEVLAGQGVWLRREACDRQIRELDRIRGDFGSPCGARSWGFPAFRAGGAAENLVPENKFSAFASYVCAARGGVEGHSLLDLRASGRMKLTVVTRSVSEGIAAELRLPH